MDDFITWDRELIKSGYFSDVFRVQAPNGRKMALKMFSSNKIDDRYRQSEVELLRRVAGGNHCVLFFNEFYDPTTLNQYILMELCEFGDLHEKFKQYRRENQFIEPSLRNSWLYELSVGLEHLHYLGIIHRDLHPKNIVFGTGETLKICDFGFSIELEYARTRAFPGDAAYASPEIINDDKNVPYDNKVDIWSYGCLLFEMFTLKKAFPGDESELVVAILLGDIPQLDLTQYFNNNFAHRIEALFLRMLDGEPVGRPSAADIKSEMERLPRGPVIAEVPHQN